MILENMVCITINEEKRKAASEEFEKYKMGVNFVDGVDGSEIETNEHGLIGGYIALSETLIDILKSAIENKLESITIFEDDVRFTENPMLAVENEEIADNVHALYLGARAFNATPKTKSDRIFVLLSGAVLLHGGIIKSALFQPWINELEKFEKPSDLCLVDAYSAKNKDGNPMYRACYFNPGIAYQEAGFSDNLKRECKKRWVD